MFDSILSGIGSVFESAGSAVGTAVDSLAGSAGNIASGYLQNKANKDQAKYNAELAATTAASEASRTKTIAYAVVGGIAALAVVLIVMKR